MATRKTSGRKASGRKASARKRTSSRTRSRSASGRLGGTLDRLDLPPTLRDYARQVTRRLDGLERELARTSAGVRQRAARLLREASHQLGRLEAQGEAGWRRLTAPYRRQLRDLLARLEKAVAPPPARKKAARKKATRKAVRRVQDAIEDVAESIE